MRKVLIPVDGSKNCNRAVTHVIQLAQECGPIEVHLLNVQPPFSGDIATFIDKKTLDDYRQEQSAEVLKSSRVLLDGAGIAYTSHIGVGDIAETIVNYIREHKIDEVILGTRDLGSIGSLLLGSVATKVIHLSPAPVTLIK